MKMMITIKDVYELIEGLNKLMDRENLPTKVAFSIQRNFKKVAEEVKSADEVRNKIVEQYKDAESKEDNPKIDKDKLKEFQAEVDELLMQEVEVDLRKINLSDLGEEVSPRTLGLIELIIEEDK